MGSQDNEWNLMAGLVLDQILERNENGNLYPLTSMEITVLSDIRDLVRPDEPVQKDEPVKQPPQKKPQKGQETPPQKEKKEQFAGLDSRDLT